MTDTPHGFKRDDDGVLHYVGGIGARFSDPGEACKMGGKFVCTTRVYSGGSFFSHACDKKPKHDPDANGNPTKCGIHSAAAVQRRKDKQDANYAKWKAESNRKQAIHNATKELEPALRKIAEGHNDPRSLAQEVIAALDTARNTK